MSPAAILGYVALGALGIVLLVVGWRVASDYTWKQSDDVAPGADMPDRHSLYMRRDRR